MVCSQLFKSIVFVSFLGTLHACASEDIGNDTASDNEPDNPSAPPSSSPDRPDIGSPDNVFQSAQLYTGYDGQNTYEILYVFGTTDNSPLGNIDVSLTNPELASVERVDMGPNGPQNLAVFRLISQAAGTTQISANYEGVNFSTNLTVYSYNPTDVANGEVRYNNPPNPNRTERRACIDCHGPDSLVPHSPFFTALWSDDQGLDVIEFGRTAVIIDERTGAEGIYDPEAGDLPHEWDLTDEEREGIMGYLRSRPLLFP